jgi:hypothetical protein
VGLQSQLWLTVRSDLLTGRCTGPAVGSEGFLAAMLVNTPLRFRQGDRGTGTVRFCSRTRDSSRRSQGYPNSLTGHSFEIWSLGQHSCLVLCC